MNVNDIINNMQETNTVSAAPIEKVASATFNSAVAAAPSVVAPQADVVDDLMKVAGSLMEAEKDAEVAHMRLCGQAFADEAISKFAGYDAEVKLAAAEAYDDSEKVAEYEEILQDAEIQGYSDAQVDLEQIKEAEYADVDLEKVAEYEEILHNAEAQGYSDAQEDLGIDKEASYEEILQDAEIQGYSDAQDDLGISKEASYDDILMNAEAQGYEDAQEDLGMMQEKQAGYDDGLSAVQDIAVGEFLKGAAAAEVLIDARRGRA